MIIKDFETFVVGNPPPRFGGRYFIFVKLVTDTGIIGYGEVYCATFSGHTVEAMLKDTAESISIYGVLRLFVYDKAYHVLWKMSLIICVLFYALCEGVAVRWALARRRPCRISLG